tara:strand:+ start:809 stop:1915 length:1107 start_codon:yes stop_codon:yes gene_type:complete
MKTLQEQYNLIKEGKGHKDVFMKEAKRLFPNIVPNAATFNQTAKLLKQRSVISENIFPLMPSSGLNPFTSFDKFINEEAKADEKKTTKEVNQAETAGYDYKDPKNLNNQIFDQYLNGLRVEMEKNPELTMDKAKEIVGKNLEKDPIFYTKNAAFKVDGLGYQELENAKEPTGKYKSSGYGDLKENKMKELNTFKKFLNEDVEEKKVVSENVTSDNLKELLEEAVAGIPSIGNPFLERPKTNYENKFESFLNEEEKVDEEKEVDEIRSAYNEEKKEVKKEEKAPKKEGKMKYQEVVKKAEKLGEMAKNKVMMEVYGKKKQELEETLGTINEDSNLSEFIDENKKKELQNEIALYEKAYMTAEANYNNNK